MVFPTLRTEHYERDTSNVQLCKNLDLLEERRVASHLRELTYKKVIVRLYNSKPQRRTASYQAGDGVVLFNERLNSVETSIGMIGLAADVD
ncbi:hypothetical protein GW17_00061530 [Ensete ventricosum]|nr:hypothetical protein GW17_00061530 [Ensete ventricosum]